MFKLVVLTGRVIRLLVVNGDFISRVTRPLVVKELIFLLSGTHKSDMTPTTTKCHSSLMLCSYLPARKASLA